MIDVNLDFSGLQDIARDLQTSAKPKTIKSSGIRPAPGPKFSGRK
jgi:hypothetical protein